MMATISPVTRRRLEIQGFVGVDEQTLAVTAPWLRMAFALCTAIAAVATMLASPALLYALVPIAAWAAVFPVHPFDLIYNHVVRRFTGTPPLPERGAPGRFACGLAAVWLVATAMAFQAGATITGYALGGTLTVVGALVSTTDICIPSLCFRMMFGFPPGSGGGTA
jgi:hypothetical protein